jgi:hypothetical protein
MWLIVRTALIWLLAIALPVQGAAAATMLSCGPGHHGAAAGAHAHADDPPGMSSHHTHNGDEAGDHASSHAHPHGSMAGHHGGDAATSHDLSVDPSPDGSPVHKTAGKCSACASCCTVAVLPTSVWPMGSSQAVDRVVPQLVAQTAVFMTGGPERPPRTFLA